jgi:predicted DNA-binding transcriptional regulator YafY
VKSTSDRRLAIRDYISAKRHTSIHELMMEYRVSYNTILRDLDAITATTAFYTTQGRTGGVHACDGWYASNHYLTAPQETLLRGLQSEQQTEADRKMLEDIISAFAMPRHDGVKKT